MVALTPALIAKIGAVKYPILVQNYSNLPRFSSTYSTLEDFELGCQGTTSVPSFISIPLGYYQGTTRVPSGYH